MLDRSDTPEDMLEPLLNGGRIMQLTAIGPDPAVVLLRDAQLQPRTPRRDTRTRPWLRHPATAAEDTVKSRGRALTMSAARNQSCRGLAAP
jgi:hypothetical protein